MNPLEHLKQVAQAWLDDDPWPENRAEVERLFKENDEAQLASCFSTELNFGTAGIRGLVGPGPGRINAVVVARVTWALCSYAKTAIEQLNERGVCIGYDGRNRSRDLAEEAATIVAGLGIRVFMMAKPVPTPLLAFSVLKQHAALGVMITASHNPREYNGYKVFWENGAQIIEPHDGAVMETFRTVPTFKKLVRTPLAEAQQSGVLIYLGDDLSNEYLLRVRDIAMHHRGHTQALSVAYTALHGVGYPWVHAALTEIGVRKIYSVEAQQEIDPMFATTPKPNPEEPGVMDSVVLLGVENQCDVAFANDPDADRLAVGVRTSENKFHRLSGNDVGVLLGHYIMEQSPLVSNNLVVSTYVSSPLLGKIAAAYGWRWEQTPTGFKWIANRALKLEREEGLRFRFGYEEALGYATGDVVRDKDGISALVLAADLAAFCKANGQTLLDRLHDIWREYGVHLSGQVSLLRTDVSLNAKTLIEMLHRAPPISIGGHRIERVKLFQDASDLIQFDLENNNRVLIRPSGTEPKIKIYVHAYGAVSLSSDISDVYGRTQRVLEHLMGDAGCITRKYTERDQNTDHG